MWGYSIGSNHIGGSGGGGGSGGVTESDVNFYDYDGTLVAGYTIAEAQALSALPSGPDHTADGLTFQEWNYTLAQVNAAASKLDISATYTTTSGKTESLIRLNAATGYAPTIYYAKSDASTMTLRLIALGDDSVAWSTTDANSGNRSVAVSGISTPGDYKLEMWISSGAGTYGLGNGSDPLIGGSAAYLQTLIKVFVGEKVTSLSTFSFYKNSALQFISIPNTVTATGDATFREATALRFVGIPKSITALGGGMFRDCRTLEMIVIPQSVTSIGLYLAHYCYAISRVILPSSVTSIGDQAFMYTTACEEIVAIRTTPPTLGASVFSGIPSSCVLSVPSASLAAYQTAANWSTYANYMEGY